MKRQTQNNTPMGGQERNVAPKRVCICRKKPNPTISFAVLPFLANLFSTETFFFSVGKRGGVHLIAWPILKFEIGKSRMPGKALMI